MTALEEKGFIPFNGTIVQILCIPSRKMYDSGRRNLCSVLNVLVRGIFWCGFRLENISIKLNLSQSGWD